MFGCKKKVKNGFEKNGKSEYKYIYIYVYIDTNTGFVAKLLWVWVCEQYGLFRVLLVMRKRKDEC